MHPRIQIQKEFSKKAITDLFLGTKFFVGLFLVFVSLVTVITLVNSTKQVTKGYMVNALDIEHQRLVKEREVKDMEISKVRSLNFIQKSNKVRGMVSPAEIVYVSPDITIARVD